ncbi:MAG: hypothetical protein ABI551_08240, partial [Polyangiaceae bacterium]
MTRTGAGLVVVGMTVFAGCGDASDGGSAVLDGGASASDAGAFDDGATPHDAGADATPSKDAGPPDPCGAALFCETFDGYGGVTTIADKQKFGPWTASLKTGAV